MQPHSPPLATRLLEVIENDILPLTRQGVAAGNKVFGAAILRRDDLSLVHAATNQEHSNTCPMWHGEMVALHGFFALPDRPPEQECLLLSTHEPCPMCAAATAWCGIPQVFFLFDYQDTETQFAIPHDIAILRQLFAPATRLNYKNEFFAAAAIQSLALDTADTARIKNIYQQYDALSAIYQAEKEHNAIPLK
ncbi:MAG: nucleoside deaminase [Proteobacteria bacterium]|nr:nucleoside deaminase [Pseudomonadota bacterium]